MGRYACIAEGEYRAEAVVKGESAITEFIEHKPLEGKISLMEDPVVMMPRFIFTSMTNSLKKTMGEAPASGVNYRAYKDMGRENVEHYKKMSVSFDLSRTKLDKDLTLLHSRFTAHGAPSVSGGKIAYGSHVVNDNFEVVDSVEKEVGSKATVFQKIGDKAIRVSTNVIGADGKRAVGTEISSIVYDAVIKKGQTYYGTADVVGKKMVVAYEPIRNSAGEIIGILFVGIPEDIVYGPLMEEKLKKINPKTISDMAFAFYSQMGWFNFVKEEWDEKTKTKTITLVAVALLVVLAVWITRPSLSGDDQSDMRGELLFPDFTKARDAASLEIVKYNEATGDVRPFKVAETKGVWSIPSHENYPADAKEHLAQAATSLMGLKVLGTASDKPGDHATYGVIDQGAIVQPVSAPSTKASPSMTTKGACQR